MRACVRACVREKTAVLRHLDAGLCKISMIVYILQTKQEQNRLEWDIHFWLGKDTSQVRPAGLLIACSHSSGHKCCIGY